MFITRHEIYVLIDLGFTHSFISYKLGSQLHLDHEDMTYELCINTPLEDVLLVDMVCKSCII